jgi:hypothetical protein
VKKKLVALIVGVVVATLALTNAFASSASTAPVHGPAVPAPAAAHQLNPNSPRPPSRTGAVYTAIAPCRIVDSRLAVGTLHNTAVRNYYVGGTSGFTAQGGQSTGCGIPVGATSITATLFVIGPVGTGGLKAYAKGSPRPSSAIMTYQNGINAASGVTLTINPAAAQALTIYNYTGAVNISIVVTGFYQAPIEGMVSPTGAIYAGSSALVSATHVTTGEYRVTIDRDVAYCTPTVDVYSGYVYGSAYAFDGNSITVYTWFLNATTHVETAADDYFYLSVSC